jgi:Predicted P-loop ATPase
MIDDEPVNLNEIDLLGNLKYSEQLKENILKSPGTKSTTVGLFGEWGSGKSSIVETAKIDLEASHPKIKFIAYDSWKYTNDGFRRTFLMQIRNDFKSKKIKQKYLENRLYSNISRYKYEWAALFFISLFFSLILIFKILEQFYEIAIIAFGILVLEWVFKILLESNTNIQTLSYFSPEQFENDFKTIIREYIKKKKCEKIVIIIDNIDRCSQEQTYQTLTDIKGFLDSKEYPIVFLIPVDDNSLANQIRERGDNPQEFLRKIFDAVLYVKPLKTIELFDFTQSLNEKYTLGLEIDTIYILSEAYATNSRRIIQLLNNLQIEFSFFDKCKKEMYEIKKMENGKEICEKVPFSKRYEKAICKLLVIREEWPVFYHEISRKPELLRKRSEVASEWNFPDSDELKIEKDIRRDSAERKLTEFLNNTKSITESEDDKLISQLMTIKNPFERIPTNILDNLNKKNYKNEVANYIKENEHNFTLLITYIVNELENEIRRSQEIRYVVGSWPEISINFDHLLKINELKNIEKFDEKIQNIIEASISSFITDLEELKGLIRYAYELKKRGRPYLYKFIVRMLNVPEHGAMITGKFYVDLFLIFVNESDVSCCTDIQVGFAKMYQEILGSDYDFWNGSKIDENRIKSLITNELIDKLLNNIEQETARRNLIYVSKFHKLNSAHIHKIQDYFIKLCHFNEEVDNKEVDFTKDCVIKKPGNFSERLFNFKSFAEDMNKNLDAENQINVSLGKAYARHFNSRQAQNPNILHTIPRN